MLRIDHLATDLIGPLSLAVAAGECIAIRGASGSGKSLFLRAIADLDPNRGRVSLDGRDRADMPAPEWRRRVMLVPAESGWWADTVAEHFPPRTDPEPWLGKVGLAGAGGWSVHRLSTGERQRAALVRALCRNPAALLLDEPTAALDGETTELAEALIGAECRAGKPVILITHDPDQARRLGGRSLTMAAGTLHPQAAP
jgi:phosphate-transporting ATPase